MGFHFNFSFSLSFLSHVKNCNHKGLGIYYLLSAFVFGISGTLISVLIRIELYSSGNRIISPENQNFYNISITLHGLFMIFFLVMPGLFGGFGNYFVVIFQGSPEVVYPRVNNFSILILFLSYLFLILSLISEFGGGTGWTLYPPLSTSFIHDFFSGVIFNGEKIVGSKNLLPSSSSCNSLYHLVSTFIGILLTFSPMHFLGFNVMPRRIPDFPDSFHSWNFLSSIGSGITFLSFAIL